MGRHKVHKNVPQHKKLHKDPGVPKLIALKAKAEVSQYKQQKKLQPRIGDSNVSPENMDIVPSISTLASMAAAADREEEQAMNESPEMRAAQIQRRQYIRTLHKVVEQSDVIIIVLDARDPEGCRSRMVEDEVRRREADGKRLIFVLNKIDLVPKENAQAWLKYLRHSAPTLPFRSSTQTQRQNLSSRTSPALLNLLKSFKPPNKSISVGVVGYPNVGKSSLINSLKRARVCPVAAEPGWTKDLQSVAIERGLRIIDSPGVIFDYSEPSDLGSQGTSRASRILLLNVLSASSVSDPLHIAQSIVSRISHEALQDIYSLPPFWTQQNGIEGEGAPDLASTATTFLTMLALTTGRLLPGGAPNLEAAATQLLRDWNSGKIPFFTPVPGVHPSLKPSEAPGAENVGETKIVNDWKPAFNLGDLWEEADRGAWGEQGSNNDEMSEAGTEMDEDDLLPSIPQKRSYSTREQTDGSSDEVPETSTKSLDDRTSPAVHNERSSVKRVKKEFTYDMDLDEHEASTMANNNPMSRKQLRKEAKKGRKLLMRGAAKDNIDSFKFGYEILVDEV